MFPQLVIVMKGNPISPLLSSAELQKKRNDRGRSRTILTGRWLLQLEEKERGHMLMVGAHVFEHSRYLFLTV